MQKKITSAGNLLNDDGELIECGYATKLIKTYNRNHIKANKLRIKEWDYYLIYNDDYGVAITVDDNSYMGLNSLTLIDFKTPKETTKSYMTFFTNGKVGLPPTSEIGDVKVTKKNYSFEILNDGRKRNIKVNIKK